MSTHVVQGWSDFYLKGRASEGDLGRFLLRKRTNERRRNLVIQQVVVRPFAADRPLCERAALKGDDAAEDGDGGGNDKQASKAG